MNDKDFILDYLHRYQKGLLDSDISNQIIQLKNKLLDVKKDTKKVIIAGNGGSAAIPVMYLLILLSKEEFVQLILTNTTNTCFANDYGYEQWLGKAIEFYGDSGDLVILISSSGKSMNMVNASSFAKKMNMDVVTFTGFSEQNPLKQKGSLNFWVDSKAYNIIENIHQIWLLMVCDLVIGKAEYSA